MINNLQTLRGVAAMMIFAHHFGFQSTITESFGDCAVAIFMMLSGFVLTVSFLPKKVSNGSLTTFSNFTLKRLIRIYPLYLLGQLCMLTIMHFHIEPLKAIADILMLQSWIPNADFYFSANSPSWFVCDLIFCYLLFLPTLKLFTTNRRTSTIIISIVLLAYFSIVVLLPDHLVHPIIYIFPPMQLPAFCLGIIAALIYGKKQTSARPAVADLTILAMAAVLIFQIYFYPAVSARLTLSSFWWPVAFALIYVLAKYDKTKCAVTTVLHTPCLIKLGDISYAFYIFHLPFLTAWRRILAHFEINLPIAADFILSASLLAGICVIIHRVIEVPITKRLDKSLLSSFKQ